ncbi:DUF7344 domain-containing protein [Halorarum halobium]|uniref:DUF7344 domain-containing protein n=1 Tax=Halorarum halobium TaxID=3075121 RepID=UPI0028B259AF|nr:ArsR family transcriptional regulator [Halobaculum sp. XH14]
MTEQDLDALLLLVADRRRRQTLHHLRHEANGETTVDGLVDRLHNGELGADGQTTDRDQIAVRLRHADLPKLADHGIVEFDPENSTIRYRSDDQFETILDSLPDELPLASL